MPCPSLADRVNPTPRRLQLITTHEESEVPLHHIHEQTLIGIHGLLFELPRQVESQVHRLQPHGLPRLLSQDSESNALLRLQPDDQPIRRAVTRRALEN